LQQNQNNNDELQPQQSSSEEIKVKPPDASSETKTAIKITEQSLTPTEYKSQNQKILTESMEVHKHPHHVMHKKKWNEYLLEFFMIFFAVFLGFIAETIREHATENSRAKEFASSMVKDLQGDTTQLRSYNSYFSRAATNIDTLMQLLSVNDPAKIPSGKLYWYGLWGGAHRYFVPNDATFQQMKSSGSLRYFKKTVAATVADYDRFCRLMQENEEKEQGIYVEVRKSRAQIFDFRYNDIANNIVQEGNLESNYNKIDSFMSTNPPLLSVDKKLFNQYVELVRSRFVGKHISLSDSLLTSATKLIKELKSTYNLKDQ